MPLIHMWIYLLLGPEKDMAQEKRQSAGRKGHGAGEKAWRWEKGAWRGAMLKGAGGNTNMSA